MSAAKAETIKRLSSRIEISHEEREREMKVLEAILEKEKTHFQWDKHGLCMATLLVQIVHNLFRKFPEWRNEADSSYPYCTPLMLSLSGSYVFFCIVITVLAIKRVNSEQYYKIKYKQGICDSDVRFSPVIVRKLVLVSLAGGWVSTALGLGGGSIFNPVLLSLGIPASVSSNTGMYLVLYTQINSTVQFII